MTKVFKIFGRFLGISFEWILILVTLFAFIIRTSPVQTYLAQQATDYLSKELNTTIRIDKVSIVFIDRVALDGVLILDQKKDTLAYIKTLYLNVDNINLKKNKIKFGQLELERGIVHVNREKETGEYNYQFLVDYFSTEKKSKKKPFEITLRRLLLTDVDLKYDDFRKGRTTYGVDFNHINLKHVYLTAQRFKSKDGVISAHIKELKAKEKSGFQLDDFNTKASISEKGVQLKDLYIKTPMSEIKMAHLHLLTNDYEDFQMVQDSVTFDAKLSASIVSLKDASYFASALEGMDQIINISADVSRNIKNLKIDNLFLKTGAKTVLQGNVVLPDFREPEKSILTERINYAYVSLDDLKKIKMPVSSKDKYLVFDDQLLRLGNFQATDLRLDGMIDQFVVKADYVRTDLGTVRLNNGIQFEENKEHDSYIFKKSDGSIYDVKIEHFQLNKFLADDNFGEVDGFFFLEGEAYSLADIRFTLIEGDLNHFDYLGYGYGNIFIREGRFQDKKFFAKIEIKDDNLKLEYNGTLDFNGNQHMEFTVDLKRSILDNLNLTEKDSTSLTAQKVIVDIYGKTANTMSGSVQMHELIYIDGNRRIRIPDLTIDVTRGKTQDVFDFTSNIANVNLTGKIDFGTLVSDFVEQFDQVFPSIINEGKAKKIKTNSKSKFTYTVDTKKDLDSLLAIFAPELKIASGTHMEGSYDGKLQKFAMDLNSPRVKYKNFDMIGLDMKQNLSSNSISADYTVNHFIYNDTIELDSVIFVTQGKQDLLTSSIKWNQNGTNRSLIDWETVIVDNRNINFTLRPSYFSINNQRWEIANQSFISLAESKIEVQKFKVERNKQFITIDGIISKNDDDKLNFKINDLDLDDLSSLIGSDVDMDGVVNGWGYISNPFTNLLYIGDAAIQNLYLNKQEIGDVYLQSQWNKGSESVGLMGDLMYRGNQTFKFDGNYFIDREKNNLDFNLLFDHTDIRFTNAFMDPDVVNNISGLLDGRLKVTGTPEVPILDGEVELISGNAKVEMLGVNFGFDGKISADEYGFYIDHMPVTDEEGNSGNLIGSIYHDQFKEWNFDLQFDLENNMSSGDSPLFGYTSNQTDKFLVLNTDYEEGAYYYGKAYVSGTANIFGYADNIEITVDLETKRGTTINFPMYGVAELSEEDSFITFKKKGIDITQIEEPKIDFTGVDLDLNFRLTPEAKLKIIFNEQTGDELSASGSGNISMQLDNLGDLTMDGTYRVKEGKYNFAMGPIKKPFHIEEGGKITWSGDPYNATLDMKTYYEVRANLSEISPDQLQGNRSTDQKVLCYLYLTESLMKPTIQFDIRAPKADETERALLERIRSDQDELNRQFFSLMLWSKFQPLAGTYAAGGSGAADLVANQINSILNQVSKDYKLNVNLGTDALTGENKVAFGVKKGFLDDRLIFSGSFGVESSDNSTQQTQNALIGDVSLDYLLNESGTIRVTVFNQSNDQSIIQEKTGGLFTQGAGLHYQEDFDNFENFKLAQYFLDIFRKKENKKYPVKRKRRQTPVPPLEDKSMWKFLREEDLIIS